jgi:LEA14-like dessication related protein
MCPRLCRLGAFLAVLGLAAAGCSRLAMLAFQKPEITFRGVEVYSFGFDGASLDVLVDVYNPNGFGFAVERLTYDLHVEDMPWGSGETESSLAVPARDTATLRLPIEVDWSRLGGVGREVLQAGKVRYGVSGRVTIRSDRGRQFEVPYDRTGEVSILESDRMR